LADKLTFPQWNGADKEVVDVKDVLIVRVEFATSDLVEELKNCLKPLLLAKFIQESGDAFEAREVSFASGCPFFDSFGGDDGV